MVEDYSLGVQLIPVDLSRCMQLILFAPLLVVYSKTGVKLKLFLLPNQSYRVCNTRCSHVRGDAKPSSLKLLHKLSSSSSPSRRIRGTSNAGLDVCVREDNPSRRHVEWCGQDMILWSACAKMPIEWLLTVPKHHIIFAYRSYRDRILLGVYPQSISSGIHKAYKWAAERSSVRATADQQSRNGAVRWGLVDIVREQTHYCLERDVMLAVVNWQHHCRPLQCLVSPLSRDNDLRLVRWLLLAHSL